MIYKKFRVKTIVRVLLLSLSVFVFFYVLQNTDYIITLLIIALLVVLQIFSLVSFVERTNRNLVSFLESIRYADFTRTFHVEGLGSSFDDLTKAFNDVITDFQKIRSEKEEHYFYIQNIIQHIEIAVIAYLPNGNVEMINNAAKKLFQIHSLKNIQNLKVWNKEIVDTLENIAPGENTLIKVHDNNDLLQLAIHATEFKLENRIITLVSIKNIQAELEEQEMQAWQKLIRVLTHEIMNSIAPIASLSSTTNFLVKELAENLPDNTKNNDECIDKETIEDVQSALNTIHKRSTGLMHFVETYRNLTRIPKPNFSIFSIKELIDNIFQLLEDEIQQNRIKCTVFIEPETLQLTADEQLIEQVIINLMKNSIHALEKTAEPRIEIKAFVNKRDKIIIQVIDNGQGILKEVQDKIFIPFFTTKASGSGIGLSLSKQILRLHNGTIAIRSEPEVETCFTLTF